MDEADSRKQHELKRLASMPDDEIDTSDIPPVSDWSGAVVGKFFRPEKQEVVLPIDADVLAWFEAHKEGAADTKSAINAALRSYVLNKESVRGE